MASILREKEGECVKEIQSKVCKETLEIVLPEEVDHYVAGEIKKEADIKIYSGKIKNIEFDFSNTKFMDSSGIGMILGRYKLIKPLGGKITLTGVAGNVDRIIKLSGLYKLV